MRTIRFGRAFGSALTIGVLVAGCNAVLGIDEPNVVAAALTADAGPCTVAPQGGCGPNETCRPVSGSTGTCVVAGANPAGSACNGEAMCAPGLLCSDGACHRPCPTLGVECGSAGDAGGGSAGAGSCAAVVLSPGGATDAAAPAPVGGDVGAAALTVGVCRVACAPDNARECGPVPSVGPVASCQIVGGNPVATDCRLASRSNNATCRQLSTDPAAACRPGYICTDQEAKPCRRVCRVGESCSNGTCIALTGGPVVHGVPLGFCPAE